MKILWVFQPVKTKPEPEQTKDTCGDRVATQCESPINPNPEIDRFDVRRSRVHICVEYESNLPYTNVRPSYVLPLAHDVNFVRGGVSTVVMKSE